MNWDNYRAEVDAVQFRPDFKQHTIKILEAAQQDRKEIPIMKVKRLSKTGLIAAVLAICLVVTAAAAVLLLRPEEVATELGDMPLAEAFTSEDAVAINDTVESNGCKITLAGMVSGKALSAYCTDLEENHTYVVVALANQDGTSYEANSDTTVTPLVSGYAPRAVNIWTLSGSFSAFSRDGIAYYLFDYNNLEIFADHTVYLAVYKGFAPSDKEFTMADDGTISFAEGYDGMHALFTLPLDEAKADPAAVEALFNETGIDQLLNPVD